MRRTKVVKEILNDITPTTLNIISSKLEKIQDNIEELKETNNSKLVQEIKQLKDVVHEQNKVVVELLSEINILVKSNLTPEHASTKYLDLFPIQTDLDLENIESQISNETMEQLSNAIKQIIGKDGIKKKLICIFDESLLLEYNVDGRQNKKRMLEYPKLMNLIYRSVYKREMLTKKSFLDEIRKAIRLMKNRHYKNVSCKKKDHQISFCNEEKSNSSTNEENNIETRNVKKKNFTFF